MSILYYLVGGSLLLWLLLRQAKTSIPCPFAQVIQWRELAENMSQKNYQVFQRSVTAEILAIIHDQSLGNAEQVYYQDGWKPRYGLCGVPLKDWAQRFDSNLKTKDLLNPEKNIALMLKTITYADTQIIAAYKRSGSYGPFPLAGLSTNAYSTYVHSPTMVITNTNDSNIHNSNTINRYSALVNCYRKVI